LEEKAPLLGAASEALRLLNQDVKS
jgi:hypothetical protein